MVEWKLLAELTHKTKKILHVSKLSSYSLDEYKKIKDTLLFKVKYTFDLIKQLELSIIDYEDISCKEITKILSETLTNLKQLNFVKHREIDYNLKNSAVEASLYSIQTRESILSFTHCLDQICSDIETNATSFFLITDKKWVETRSMTLRLEFTDRIETIFDVDFLAFYSKYQNNFQQSTACYEDQVKYNLTRFARCVKSNQQ
jgi:hypothetical protein